MAAPGYGQRDTFFGIPLPKGTTTTEWGVSEFINDIMGGGRNAQGGSRINEAIQERTFSPSSPGNYNGAAAEFSQADGEVVDGEYIDPIQKRDGGNTGGGGNTGSGIPSSSNGGGNSDNGSQYSGPTDEDVNNIYNGSMNALREVEGRVNSGFNESVDFLGDSTQTQIGRANEDQALQLDANSGEQNNFNDTLRDAFEQAVRSYNSLRQQTISRFGGGSSAGGAVGELARQEFFRQQGGLNKEQARGNVEFGKQANEIRLFASRKIGDLENYKKEAILTLRQSLNDQLNEISLRRGDIESNKARDRVNLMQQAQDRLYEIQARDKEFRQSIAASAIENLQNASGRVFTPQEIEAYIQDFTQTPNSIGGSSGSSFDALSQAQAAARSQDSNDELQTAGLVQG